MTLAKELVENNQPVVVLHYLVLCKKFWRMDNGRLDEWIMPRYAAVRNQISAASLTTNGRFGTQRVGSSE